jgi:predicted nucleic acid-binding Zn ribbon protein
LIVRRQTPEYVGAAQKKFAWIIGLMLVLIMLVLVVYLNSYSPISGIICLICLIFLLFESAFGICLGCLFYGWFYGKKAQYCPGEICEIKDRQEIQKTSWMQILIVLAFIAFIVVSVMLFSETFAEKPQDLFKMFD